MSPCVVHSADPYIARRIHDYLFFSAVRLNDPVQEYLFSPVQGDITGNLCWNENGSVLDSQIDMPAGSGCRDFIDYPLKKHQFAISRSIGERAGKRLLPDKGKYSMPRGYCHSNGKQETEGSPFLATEHT